MFLSLHRSVLALRARAEQGYTGLAKYYGDSSCTNVFLCLHRYMLAPDGRAISVLFIQAIKLRAQQEYTVLANQSRIYALAKPV